MTPVHKIHRSISAAVLLLAFIAPSLCLPAAEKPLTEKEKIEALIKHLEGLKEATFIRNGSDYDARTAAKFLRGKWKAREKAIKTASDFIENVASVSSTTGKPYVIRFKDAREVKSGDYLKDELKKLDPDLRDVKPQAHDLHRRSGFENYL